MTFTEDINEILEYETKYKKRYEQFQKYLQEKNYADACLFSMENPDLKEVFTRNDLVILTNYYEETINRIVSGLVGRTNENADKLRKSLDYLIERVGGKLKIK